MSSPSRIGDGKTVQAFKPALLEPAVRAEMPSLRYSRIPHPAGRSAAFRPYTGVPIPPFRQHRGHFAASRREAAMSWRQAIAGTDRKNSPMPVGKGERPVHSSRISARRNVAAGIRTSPLPVPSSNPLHPPQPIRNKETVARLHGCPVSVSQQQTGDDRTGFSCLSIAISVYIKISYIITTGLEAKILTKCSLYIKLDMVNDFFRGGRNWGVVQ